VQHLHSIFVSTYAILFLGTPHNGSSKAGLASVGSRMISALTPSKVVDTNSQLADALYEGSEVLQNITDMFAPLMKNFRIYFFWEQEKTDLGGSLGYVCISVSLTLSSFVVSNISDNFPCCLKALLPPKYPLVVANEYGRL
jgi:hypothetical protein